MCPFSTSLPTGDGPNRYSPSAVKDWNPRRKSVSNACERCRRRKIRCDGDTPCATCNRFSLPCVRSQKTKEVVASEHQAALESRIHQLESQLAAHVSAPMHGMETIDESIISAAPFDWQSPPPQLTVNTQMPAPYAPGQNMDLSGSFSAGSLPSISLTECEPFPNVASPCDSPVPSLYSGTTSSAMSQTFSPPPIPHTAPSWEFMAQHGLKPQLTTSGDPSRRTSISSTSRDSDDPAVSPYPDVESDLDLQPIGPPPALPRAGIFASHGESTPPHQSRATSVFSDRSRAISAIPFPSRFEAETLTAEFVSLLDSMKDQKLYTMTPALFAKLCDTVYPDPSNRTSSVETLVSVPMARFHVFLSMAIGMKHRIRDSLERTNALLDRCYELAMQQASSSLFWQEQGGVEAAQLLSIFASIKSTSNADPKPLQSSFSW
ncbi:hypothetical protein BU24DRAFT_428230 [Aaosphaeria arxii CBS 175.79]|uniref:Zn(2)-C6 fungal-type domain-containing protein n=1 Tax=Aaosphaeria arxii CBS 175.79 TaxID=1450172 RepID=A0A6A5XBA5_9PLEO|nr:uncharacterized protein BU24DRAFT_428230 [Aaosphaeria arxii CBS 175.79]KAF2010221.1 hypothetical protein BU24DRAFT_428230 [Aaosphaeria arxii CBS 175.79]